MSDPVDVIVVSIPRFVWCWFAYVLCRHVVPVTWRLWFTLLLSAGFYAYTPRWEFRGLFFIAAYNEEAADA